MILDIMDLCSMHNSLFVTVTDEQEKAVEMDVFTPWFLIVDRINSSLPIISCSRLRIFFCFTSYGLFTGGFSKTLTG